MKNKVIVKDKDEWSSLANFIGNIIAKYADEIDFDSLPDPDVYLQKRYILEKMMSLLFLYLSFPDLAEMRLMFSIHFRLCKTLE